MDAYKIFVCFVQKYNKVPYNVKEFANTSSVINSRRSASPDAEALELGTVTGIMMVILIDVLLGFEYYKPDGSLRRAFTKIFNAKNVSRTLVLTIIVLILPILVLLLFLASVYKILCSVIIRKDQYFVGFLDSFDVFWSLEDDNSKSIINVLGILESESAHAVAANIKEKLKSIIPEHENDKIFYRRNEEFGFYYWRRYSLVDMDQYVEIVDLPNLNDLQHSDMFDLEHLLSDLQRQPLPYKDEGLFKILITRQRVGNHNKNRGDYGIVFRIHHSVGDGVALIEFLCQTFADNTSECPVHMFSMPENCNQNSPGNLINMMQKLLEFPICFVDGILRNPDENALHGPPLVGKKVFKWTESDENLLLMVKDIKENIQQINFTDVLLTALSSGLQNYLKETVAPVPADIAVILPVRFPKPSTEKNLILKNDFSVTILDVPVKELNFNEIKERCKIFRKSADPLTNYYFLKIACSIMPKSILVPLLNSSQATLVFSNLPGPATLSICGGNQLKSLVFFVPHKGNTGLGVTALSYGGALRFAVMADEALVSSPEQLSVILDGMVNEITRLHRLYGDSQFERAAKYLILNHNTTQYLKPSHRSIFFFSNIA